MEASRRSLRGSTLARTCPARHRPATSPPGRGAFVPVRRSGSSRTRSTTSARSSRGWRAGAWRCSLTTTARLRRSLTGRRTRSSPTACATALRALAQRCTVCVVSGRDRPVVQKLMGVDDLIVAGSHGFDIWSPGGEGDPASRGRRLRGADRQVTERRRERTRSIAGALVEPKRSSVAVHYRLVDEAERPLVGRSGRRDARRARGQR